MRSHRAFFPTSVYSSIVARRLCGGGRSVSSMENLILREWIFPDACCEALKADSRIQGSVAVPSHGIKAVPTGFGRDFDHPLSTRLCTNEWPDTWAATNADEGKMDHKLAGMVKDGSGTAVQSTIPTSTSRIHPSNCGLWREEALVTYRIRIDVDPAAVIVLHTNTPLFELR